MQVTVITAKATIKDAQGREVEGLILTCSRCGETVEVYGTSGASLRRGFVKLREACGLSGPRADWRASQTNRR
jgi:hypothetical protein